MSEEEFAPYFLLICLIYLTLAYVSSSSATIQAISASVGTIGPSAGRRDGKPGNSCHKESVRYQN